MPAAGPETRTIATAAFPGALARAKIVSSKRIFSAASIAAQLGSGV